MGMKGETRCDPDGPAEEVLKSEVTAWRVPVGWVPADTAWSAVHRAVPQAYL